MKLGNEVRDRITGIEGIAFGITDWMYGCRTISVKPHTLGTDGAPGAAMSFDEGQLEVVGVGLADFTEPTAFTGGPDRPVVRDRSV